MKTIFPLGLFILAAFLHTGCYRGEEGCTDPVARNFSALADVDNGKCDYYNINLRLNQYYIDGTDTVAMAYGDTLTDASNNPFVVLGMPFYLTGFRLVRADGTEAGTRNTLTIKVNGESQTVESNFVLVTAGDLQVSPGEVSETGTFTRLKFDLGLPPALNHADPTLYSTSSIFSDEYPLQMHISEADGYIFLRADVVSGTDTLACTISGDNQLLSIDLAFPTPVDVVSGADVSLGLGINYTAWFSGVDFQTQTVSDIAARLLLNAPASFELED